MTYTAQVRRIESIQQIENNPFMANINGEEVFVESPSFQEGSLVVFIAPEISIPVSLIPNLAGDNYKLKPDAIQASIPVVVPISAIPEKWDSEANTMLSNEDLYSEFEEVSEWLFLK